MDIDKLECRMMSFHILAAKDDSKSSSQPSPSILKPWTII
jgi:hypothetical protein